MPSLSMVFDLLAIDRASAVFDKVGGSAAVAGREVEASSGSMSAAGAKMAAGVGIAAAAVTAYSVKMAADFQSATTRLVTSAGESEQNLGKVRTGLLDLMGQVGYSSDELTKAMYKVESGGQHGADGLTVLKAAAQGAKTENADLTTVADAVTSAMQDYHLKASDAADVTSKLVAATASGKMTFEELAGSLSAILPIASANHISLNDILGDLASMTVHGMTADQATQNLADTVRHLAAPTAQSTKELAALGISATDVSTNLGTKGLSGTLNEITDAIQKKMGPGSTQIVLDLGDALNKLPASVRSFAQGLLDGTHTVGDLRAEIKKLPPDQAAALSSFDSLITSTHQVGSETKSAGQVYQSYSGALRLALGDATSMNTALMITGENTNTTNTAIQNVTKATADARGNVKGWSDIQSTFNQQLSEAAGHAQAMAIEFGTHLLPALSSGLGWVNSTGVPALEHLGTAVGDAVHWFMGLPGPVKEFAGALALLRIADMAGVFDKLSGAVQRFRDTMAVQSALGQMEQAAGNAEANIGRLGSTMSRLTSGGFAALKSGIGSVVEAFGGPWMIGLAAAGAALYGLFQMFQKENQEVQQGTQAVTDYYKAMAAGGQGALPAMEALQAKQEELAKAQRDLANAPVDTEADVTAYNVLKDHVKDLTTEVNRGQQNWNDYYNSLGLVDQKTADVNVASAHLQEVMKTHAAGSLEVREATNQVQQALAAQKQAQDDLNQTTKTALQLSQEQAQADLGMVGSALAVKQSYDEFNTSLAQYQADLKGGKTSAADLTREQDALNNQTISVAQSAGAAGEAWAKANGVTDTATASQYGQLLALQKVAQAMGKDTPAAVTTLIGSLSASVAQGHLTATQMDGITTAVDGIPGQKKIDVTADTSQAQTALNGLISSYQHVQYTGTAIVVNGRVIANAEGNLLQAYAAGGMSPMSSSVAQVVQPGTLRVIGDNPVSDEAFIPINNSSRSMKILGETANRMGMGLVAMANGGFVASVDRFTAQPSSAMLDSAGRAAAVIGGAMSAPGAGAGAARWRGVVDSVLRALGLPLSVDSGVLSLIQAESGGNPNAINLTDSNARAGHPSQGLMQTIPGTFRAYAGPYASRGITDPFANIYAGVNYALHTYGLGMLAAGGRHNSMGRYIGYETGTNYVPNDGPAYLHKGEAVIPAAINARMGNGPVQITGRLEIGGDGMATLIGEVLDMATDRGAYNG